MLKCFISIQVMLAKDGMLIPKREHASPGRSYMALARGTWMAMLGTRSVGTYLCMVEGNNYEASHILWYVLYPTYILHHYATLAANETGKCVLSDRHVQCWHNMYEP
jgi:hypothetical protein